MGDPETLVGRECGMATSVAMLRTLSRVMDVWDVCRNKSAEE